jgi:hypothetical protein
LWRWTTRTRPPGEPPSSASPGVPTSAAVPSRHGTSATTVPAFVDANVLVYAEDRDAGSKHLVVRDLIADL